MAEMTLSFPVSTIERSEVGPLIGSWLSGTRRFRYIACANPHSLVVAGGDSAFAAALRDADLLVPDGIGIVLSSRLRRGRIKERVTGTDVFLATCEQLVARGGGRMFFLGSTEATLRGIRERLEREYPEITVAGTYSPPFAEDFDEEELKRQAEIVNAAAPDVLCVGLSAPKQERWLWAQRARLDVPVALAIGAAFDFYAGTKRRAGQTLQRMGLEWLPRLMSEPTRLWRRTFVSGPVFLWRAATEERPAPQVEKALT